MNQQTALAYVRAEMSCRSAAWALHERTLAALLSVAAGELSVEELPEEHRTQAVRASQSTTTGGIALLPLRGLIVPRASFLSMLFGGGGGLNSFRAGLRDAVNDNEITAIVIDVDSPGGSADLLAETAAEIRAAREVKPVVSVANTWAASAAYWLAAQGDELVVTPSGQVGSVGVFTAHEDQSALEEKIGIKTTLISAGKYKTEGNPHMPLSDDARAAMQAIVDEYYDMFVADVAAGRGTSAAAVRAGYGQGRMVTARQAVDLGMADRVDSLQATVERLVREPARPRRAGAEDKTGHPAAQLDPGSPLVDEEAAARTRTALLAIHMGR